jgi:hypothetical protein
MEKGGTYAERIKIIKHSVKASDAGEHFKLIN